MPCCRQSRFRKTTFIAASLKLRPNDCIIRVRKTIIEAPEVYHESGQAVRRDLFEYVTAIPHVECAFEGMGPTHIRWIESQTAIRTAWNSERSNRPCHTLQHNCHPERCPCIQAKVSCTPSCHSRVDQSIVRCPSCERPLRFTSQFDDDRLIEQKAFSCKNLPSTEFIFRPLAGVFTELEPGWDTRGYDLQIGVTRHDNDSQGCPPVVIRHDPSINLSRPFYTISECHICSRLQTSISGNKLRMLLSTEMQKIVSNPPPCTSLSQSSKCHLTLAREDLLIATSKFEQ
ncbi:hypothetical protein F5B21DRAFT_379830 [Xylaria acuta]|nr:hypothetical protein F5B21DRAFT_379830 [Xylaria acuta]